MSCCTVFSEAVLVIVESRKRLSITSTRTIYIGGLLEWFAFEPGMVIQDGT